MRTIHGAARVLRRGALGALLALSSGVSPTMAQAPPATGPVRGYLPQMQQQLPTPGGAQAPIPEPTQVPPGLPPGAMPAPTMVPPPEPANKRHKDDPIPTAEVQARVDTFIADIQGPEVILELKTQKSKLVRTRVPLVRVAIADPSVVEIVNFSTNEFELIGRTTGETTLTLWFAGGEPGGYAPNLRYLVKVTRTEQDEERAEIEYGMLEKRINEMFPNSFVQLIPVADKLIVRGQARDSEEAAQIMSVIRGGAVDQTGSYLGLGSYFNFGYGAGFGGTAQGVAARIPGANDMPAYAVINLLRIPGIEQVMLKVRVAELKRSALREMGANFSAQAGDFSFASVLNVNGAFQAVLDSAQVQLALSALSSNHMSKILAEPNLVTLSGYPASFIAGGQFAVPTVVGVGGAQAATTQFHGYGTQIQFTPTVLDKDHIRLQVAPTFSDINDATSVNGIFGLNTRSVTTTVDLREGQWLAIAGLLQDQQAGSKARVPWIGDIPILDMVFSQKQATRDETELVILVSPELVHPMEADQAPLIITGMEVTEPDDLAFYIGGRYEGVPDHHHRSTVWPVYMYNWQTAKFRALRDAKRAAHYGRADRYYMNGPIGFSN